MSLDNVKAIHLKSGDMISITEQQCQQVQRDLLAGAEWVMIQGELLHKGTIARVGNHDMTVDMKRYKDYDETLELGRPSEPVDQLTTVKIDDQYRLFPPLHHRTTPLNTPSTY